MANGYGFETNVHRKDPYKNFKFIIKWDIDDSGNQQPIMGVSKVSALKRTTEVVTHRSGGDNSRDHKSPGRTSYEGITCERGITHNLEFEKWANKIHSDAGDSLMDLVGSRNNVLINRN